MRTLEGKSGAWVVIWGKRGKDVGFWSRELLQSCLGLRGAEWKAGGHIPVCAVAARRVAEFAGGPAPSCPCHF